MKLIETLGADVQVGDRLIICSTIHRVLRKRHIATFICWDQWELLLEVIPSSAQLAAGHTIDYVYRDVCCDDVLSKYIETEL